MFSIWYWKMSEEQAIVLGIETCNKVKKESINNGIDNLDLEEYKINRSFSRQPKPNSVRCETVSVKNDKVHLVDDEQDNHNISSSLTGAQKYSIIKITTEKEQVANVSNINDLLGNHESSEKVTCDFHDGKLAQDGKLTLVKDSVDKLNYEINNQHSTKPFSYSNEYANNFVKHNGVSIVENVHDNVLAGDSIHDSVLADENIQKGVLTGESIHGNGSIGVNANDSVLTGESVLAHLDMININSKTGIVLYTHNHTAVKDQRGIESTCPNLHQKIDKQVNKDSADDLDGGKISDLNSSVHIVGTPCISSHDGQHYVEEDLQQLVLSLTLHNKDWTVTLDKISKLMACPENNDKHMNLTDILVSTNIAVKFGEYFKINCIDSLQKFNNNTESVADFWSSVKQILTLIWIACDSNVNFCQHVLSCDIFPFIVSELKNMSVTQYSMSENTTFVVKAILGILHNVARHLPYCKWKLRQEGVVNAVFSYLQSDSQMIRLKSLIVLSYIVSEAENELITSNDDNFIFVFQVLEDALKSPHHKSRKFGMSAFEILIGLHNLAVNDQNKIKMVQNGILPLFDNIMLEGNLAEIKIIITTLWSLSFQHYNKKIIRDMNTLMEKLSELQHSDDEEICHAARGTLWELANTAKSSITDTRWLSSLSADNDSNMPHVMISYQWESQTIMLKVKDRLRQAGYKVWMDVEHMSGSTLEAMALAVEKAAVILICMSQKYKDSPNCRTEAEYVYRLQKDFIPLRLQNEYVPDGWLGILVGTRLYFDVYTEGLAATQIPNLVKELKDRGRINSSVDIPDQAGIMPWCLASSRKIFPRSHLAMATEVASWTCDDVKKWLSHIGITQPGIQEKFDGIDGLLLLEMHTIQTTAPEYFNAMLTHHLMIPIVQTLMLSRAIRELKSSI